MDIKEELKQTLNLSLIIGLLLFFIFVELRLSENIVSLVPVLIISSIFLLVGVITAHKKYERYNGLTFLIFGLIIILGSIINFISNGFSSLALLETLIGFILVIYGIHLRRKF
ncbi:hypothetical protein CL617_03185 [archaeon]|nr:hypothetical protein [archaeon]|tara:strand:- start:5131 stop:5469 length:339 start_codon:yes stop_codon:yes gene_type:complete